MNLIKEIRTQLKLTQKEFAKPMGIHENLVSSWERSERNPNQKTLLRLTENYPVVFVMMDGKMTAFMGEIEIKSELIEGLDDLQQANIEGINNNLQIKLDK